MNNIKNNIYWAKNLTKDDLVNLETSVEKMKDEDEMCKTEQLEEYRILNLDTLKEEMDNFLKGKNK